MDIQTKYYKVTGKQLLGTQGGRSTGSTEGQQGRITDTWIQHRNAASICKRKACQTTGPVRDRGLLSTDRLFTFKATNKYLKGTLVAEALRENEPTVTKTAQHFRGTRSEPGASVPAQSPG